MIKEPLKIIIRRFTSRILESGLLVIGVALGAGAASSGIALHMQTSRFNTEVMYSSDYRELVVTTVDNIEDMDQAAIETLKTGHAILTLDDLEAAELVPQISYAYIKEPTQMGFFNEEMISEKGGMENLELYRPKEGDDDKETSLFFEMLDTFKNAKDNSDYIIPEIKELFGYSVTSQFFNAGNIVAEFGSLFSITDMTSSKNIVVLGSETADLLSGDKSVETLIGKKIISFDIYYTIVGILEPIGSDYDNFYFTAHKKNRNENSKLRFTVSDPTDLDETALLLKEWFKSEYGVGQIVISNPAVEAQRIISRNRGITFLILFLSFAGLFIAAVNVSNILLSRNIKMRRHMGILKAMGASRQDVLSLFTLEALFITAIGSVLGVGLALPLSGVLERSMDLSRGSVLNIIPGVFFSFLLTFIFAVLPSWQNSGLKAAEDMR